MTEFFKIAGPGGLALFESFMAYPKALALLDGGGRVELVNLHFRGRFGTEGLDTEGLARSAATEDDYWRVAGLSPVDGKPVEAGARAVRSGGRVLLIFDDEDEDSLAADLQRLRERVAQLERLAATDHLTGAWNRAHFDRVIEAEMARSRAARQPVTLVLLDIDHFKRVNDTWGHGIGDAALRDLVRLVRAKIRPTDVLFRWGGEEFMVLVASAGYLGGERVAENLRQAVADHRFAGVGALTISLGVAELDRDESPAEWFRRLDAALYAAKHEGRNRVVVDRRGSSETWTTAGPRSPLHLAWQEAYECGHAAIDAEHRELFVLANALIDALPAAKTDPPLFRAAFDRLLNHVQDHFRAEEAILDALGYDQAEEHRRAHQGLLRRAGQLRARCATGEVTLGAVVEFLAQDVIARHLLTVDRAFFPLFQPAPAG